VYKLNRIQIQVHVDVGWNNSHLTEFEHEGPGILSDERASI